MPVMQNEREGGQPQMLLELLALIFGAGQPRSAWNNAQIHSVCTHTLNGTMEQHIVLNILTYSIVSHGGIIYQPYHFALNSLRSIVRQRLKKSTNQFVSNFIIPDVDPYKISSYPQKSREAITGAQPLCEDKPTCKVKKIC